VIPPLLNDFIALMKDTSLVAFLGLTEVVQAGFDVQTELFNGSGLVLGAVLFLVITIPLARLVDALIARQQRQTSRGGGGDGGDAAMTMGGQPTPTAGRGLAGA
jgi:polar amino acid transport system permease protein